MNRVVRTALAALAATALAGGLVASCSGGGAERAGDQSTTGSSGSSATAGPSGSSSSPSSGSASPQPTTSSVGPASPTMRPTHAARPLRSTATFDPAVTVHVASIKAVTVKGRGPGELSGPAVAVTLVLVNGTSKPLDATNSVVTATYGASRTPAVDSSSSPSNPWRGTVAAGGTSSGTYVFLVPDKQRRSVQLTISYDPTKPVVLLQGNASA